MKLIIAIVQNEDANRLTARLMQESYSVTRLATTGGFLRVGNTTLLLGLEEHKVDGALTIIKEVSRARKQTATLPSPVIAGVDSYASSVTNAPESIEALVGGATVFVVDVEQFQKY